MRRPRNKYHRTIGQKTLRNPVERDSDGIDRITFDSIGAAIRDSMADYAQNEGNLAFIRANLAAHFSGTDPWAHYFTKQTLLDVIANPPAELLAAVEKMRDQLRDEVAPPVTTRRHVRRNQDWGDELTPESVLVRSLSPWERMSRETEAKRSVTIGVNVSVSCMRKPHELLWRGAAAAALADILTQRGFNVEIIAYWSITAMSTGSKHVVAKYLVKRPDMPLDIGTVSVALAEIAFARLVALYGLARHMEGTLDDCLGHPEMLPQRDRLGIDYLADSDILCEGAAVNWITRASAHAESGVAHVN